MAQTKTRPMPFDEGDYLAAVPQAARRADVVALIDLLRKVTGYAPRLWASMVGFGSYHYRYEGGHEGEAFLAGLAVRKAEIAVYLQADFPERDALLARLGRHKMAKACLYLRRLADVDLAVLEALVRGSVQEIERRHGRS